MAELTTPAPIQTPPMHRTGPHAVPDGTIAQFFKGAGYPLEGLSFIRHHKLWKMASLAIAINALLIVVAVAAAWYFLGDFVASIEPWLVGPNPDPDSWWIDLLTITAKVLVVVTYVVAATAIILIVALLGQAIASPVLDLLSERVEGIVLGTPEYPFGVGRTIKSLLLAASDLVWTILFLVFVNLPVWILGFILSPVAATISFFVSTLVIAHEFISFPLGRKLVSYRRRWRVVWRNKWLSFGFGTATMALFLIPGLNLALLPIITAGGTLLYSDLEAAGRVNLD